MATPRASPRSRSTRLRGWCAHAGSRPWISRRRAWLASNGSNPPLNAFITVTAEVARGLWRGPLHGIPIALKDLVDSAGVRTTVASGLFAEHVPEAMPRWCGGCERQAPCYMTDIREDARRTLDNGEERPLARGQNESAWSQKLFRSHHSRA